jgi:hypothetical protein
MRGAATLPSRSAAELRCREGEGFMRCITARLRARAKYSPSARGSAPRGVGPIQEREPPRRPRPASVP